MTDNSNKQVITPDENYEKTLSMIPMPKDTNPKGNIFGGWLLAQLDLAGSVLPRQNMKFIVTKAVNFVNFIAPIHVGDKVDFFAQTTHVGKTSETIHLIVVAERYNASDKITVAEAEFVYVDIGR